MCVVHGIGMCYSEIVMGYDSSAGIIHDISLSMQDYFEIFSKICKI